MFFLVRYPVIFLAIVISSFSHAHTCTDKPLMPYPQEITCVDGALTVGAALMVAVETENPRIEQALQIFGQQLKQHKGTELLQQAGPDIPVLRIRTQADTRLDLGIEREAYKLVVSPEGIDISAEAWQGAFYGLQTLLQLLTADNSDEVKLPLVTITDRPRFAWRGVLIDSSRHFFSTETLKRQLDGMAAAKLNVFHWHLTDDQAWRLALDSYPKLHKLTSQNRYYSHSDVKEIIDYAAARAIHVLPEVDMPGHASAIAHAYPELMSAPGPYPLEDRWGVHTPLLNPANPQVHRFAEKVLTEVAALFPFEYVHIGGDEVNPRDWYNNSDIKRFMAEKNLQDSQALHAWFNQKLADILTSLDRKMIGWDEVLHSDLPKGTVVQSWQGPDALGRAVNRGFPALLSTGFYLDQPQYSDYHYRVRVLPEPLAVDDTPGADEHWQSWSFSFDRKRGSAISGSFTLIRDAENHLRGFIDFAGKSREQLHQITLGNQHIGFSVDTWMGPVQARLTYSDKTLAGDWVVGNAPYTVSGELIAASTIKGSTIPDGIAKEVIAPDKIQDVLGGEAALWSEMVTEDSIDLRLWPRAFVVAERLWSDASLRDEAFMYQRLDALSAWSTSVIGLQHFQQTEQALLRLFASTEQAAAKNLISALEPAHYYHRHHEKSVNETYSRRDPLNRLADALPAESRQVQKFAQLLQRWQAAPFKGDDYQLLYQQLEDWQKSSANFLENPDGDIRRVAKQVNTTATIGLQLINALKRDTAIPQSQRILLRQQLREAQGIHSEMVVALAYPLEGLLDASDYYRSHDWTAEHTFTDGIEGPAVDRAGYLYAVNAGRQGTIGKVSERNSVEIYAKLPEGSIANAIRFDNKGAMLVADYTGHNILRLTDQKQWQVLAHNSAMHQPNDIVVADNGIIYASDPNWADSSGQLWRIDTDGTTTVLEKNMGTTNGIELSPDGRRLYVNESVQRTIWQYRVADDGSLHDKQLFYRFSKHGMDGMKVDVKGNVYVARYGAGTVAIFSPEAELLREVALTGQFPTNLTFGGEDGKRVFVTMQQRGMIESFLSENPGSDWAKQQRGY